ncbi:LptF/LptG family permease, partial [bacterium]|nr:LptF/LptG family permease [bacterium]
GKDRLDNELMLDELWEMIQRSKPNSREYFGYLDEFHGRIVTILSCICFAIFALPVGIFNPRNPKAGNIVYLISVLIIYFLIFAQTRSLLIQGKVPPIALYISLLFVVLNGLVKYFKINQNIDSFSEYLRIRKIVN